MGVPWHSGCNGALSLDVPGITTQMVMHAAEYRVGLDQSTIVMSDAILFSDTVAAM